VYLAAAAGEVVVHGWEEPVRLSAESAAALGVARATGARDVKTSALVVGELAQRRTDAVRADRLLFPRIGPVTAHEPVSAAEALTRLVRAAPCIMVQPDLAQSYLTVLGRAAALPADALTLGSELLRAPARLATYLTDMIRD
jgi:hypothetical protein